LLRKVFATFSCLLAAWIASAQPLKKNTAVLAPQAKQYVFTHFNSFNGLASNIVMNVIQDKRRFIWLATVDGLQRYDGNKFMTFRNEPGNPRTIPSNVISKVIEDKRGNLWVLTEFKKIGLFNGNDFTYTEILLEGNTAQEPFTISMLEVDSKGNATVFVANKGIFTYDGTRKMFRFTDPIKFPGDSYIGALYNESNGQYWFAAYWGLSMYDSKTKNLNYGGHNPDNNEVIKQLGSQKKLVNVFGEYAGTFWFVTWNTNEDGAPWIEAHDLRTGRRERYSIGKQFGLGYFEVASFLRQRNGRVWVHGKGFLAEYTGGKQPFQLVRNEHGAQSIKFDRIHSMYEDRENNVWVASDNGVFLFNPDAQIFHSYKLQRPDGSGLVEGPAQTALQLENGNVLVGSWGGGLYYYDSAFNQASLPRGLQSHQNIFAAWCMRTHSITHKVWIGLQGGGMIVYDPATEKSESFYHEAMEGRTVRTVTEDRYGNLWFGLQGGQIIKWNLKASGGDVKKGYTKIKPKDGYYLFRLITDSKGYIWAASVGTGIYKFDPETNAQLEHIDSKSPEGRRLMVDGASDILQYNDSLMLVASGGINILNLNTGRITYITNIDGLPANTVMCFQKDTKGILWVGLMHGLCRANLEKKIFTRYDRRDGLFFDNFFQSGVYKMNDGRLIFLTDHDFFTFNTDRLEKVADPPRPVITEFRIANKQAWSDTLGVGDRMVLDYDNSTIQIEFNGLSYVRQNKVLYFYKLENLDKDWVAAGDRLQALYSYLPSGSYTFRVRSENENGISSPELSFQILVQPPFWRTWWFYGLIVLLAASILYWIDRERVGRIVALQKVRTQIAANLHQDINTTLNNINLLSEMAKIKADKDIDRSKEYIDQISEKSHNMIIAMDDMLWSINPANDNMDKTILRMKEFVEALKNRHGAGMQMVVDNEVRSLKTDMATRHEIFLVFKEILRDMVLRTPEGQFLINIDLVRSRLYLKIHDTSPNAGASVNSVTMAGMKKRVEAIGAELDIQTVKEGVAVILLMPVKQ
jgi:ligand-binding sensor domain-containing protein